MTEVRRRCLSPYSSRSARRRTALPSSSRPAIASPTETASGAGVVSRSRRATCSASASGQSGSTTTNEAGAAGAATAGQDSDGDEPAAEQHEHLAVPEAHAPPQQVDESGGDEGDRRHEGQELVVALVPLRQQHDEPAQGSAVP